jgi:hypothetical protein
MMLKLDILKVGILERVILNQVILIHKLQYLNLNEMLEYIEVTSIIVQMYVLYYILIIALVKAIYQ